MRAARVLVAATLVLGACTSSGQGNQGTPSPGGDTNQGSHDPESATSGLEPVRVQRRDFQIIYRLEGVTRNGDLVALVDHPQLRLDTDLTSGEMVARGDVVGDAVIRDDVRRDLEVGSANSSIDRGRLEELEGLGGPVTTPVSGTLVVDAQTAGVRNPGIDVTIDLSPLQLLRYRSLSFQGTAEVETVVGPRQVECVHVWVEGIGQDMAAVAGEESEQDVGSDSSARLHCRLPGGIETVEGLRASLTVASETIRDALVVPNLFVGYNVSSDGYVVNVVGDNGEPVQIPIVVGVTDGVVRVVTSDLATGLELLPPDVAGTDDPGG